MNAEFNRRFMAAMVKVRALVMGTAPKRELKEFHRRFERAIDDVRLIVTGPRNEAYNDNGIDVTDYFPDRAAFAQMVHLKSTRMRSQITHDAAALFETMTDESAYALMFMAHLIEEMEKEAE